MRKKIRITIPLVTGDKFKIGFGARPKSMKSAGGILNRLERVLMRLNSSAKTSIRVKYGKHTANETLVSDDAQYLIYTTSCFLEDYLSKDSMRQRIRIYMRYLKVGGGEML